MTEPSTDLVVHVPSGALAHTSSFDLAPQAWSLAQKICDTEFVPKGLRGSPEKVLAAMLTGNELQIGPMNALAKIHVIEGKPGAAAELMRALILRDGHEFWIEESSNTRVTVGIKRKGSTREQRFTWTLDDAKQAGVAGKDVWKKYPRAMLLARATAEGARAVCPDSIAGMSYTVEELTDGGVFDPEDVTNGQAPPVTAGAAPAKRTAKATRAATATAPSAPPLNVDEPFLPAAEQPPLPGEDDDVVDAEIVPDEPPGPPATSTPDDGPSPMAPRNLVQRLQILCSAMGITQKPQRLAWASGHIGRDIGSFNDLTLDEVNELIGLAEAETADDDGGEP